MNLILYPLASININEQNASSQIEALWQSVVEKLPKAVRYGIYHHYTEQGCQYSIATELDLGRQFPPINVDLGWYECFPTHTEQLQETWQDILRKSKQGLLKRALTVDFEKHAPDGKVEVYISVSPHC